MRVEVGFLTVLLAMPAFAQAQSLTADEPDSAPLVLASADPNSVFVPRVSVAPLAAPQIRYVAQPSGLDRIDPANMTVLGGEIGGNGVQGGAVVSLTWPTE